jgi:acetylornithine deacetylase/succinyl-diaminopimelate desuccinylase-like protein
VSAELDALIHEAADWLRIPSISAGARNDEALRAAAEWAQRRVLAAGGTCELEDTAGGAPLVVGELKAARADAPTVLIYGHYDVQDPGDESDWTTPPFEPDIRDGRIYARGACDDKGNFLPLLHVACALADAGELPVNVRVLVEGAEETGSDDVNKWVLADARGADCAIVFDTGMLDPDTPALTVSTRGMVFAHLTIRTGERPAHSGLYGGTALNALHALHAVLAAVLPGPDGGIPEPLRQGVEPPTEEERVAWASLPDGATVLAEAGAVPADGGAAAEFHERTTADASLDVHRIAGGETRTIVPPEARCDLSVRLAPGQDPATIEAALEALLRGALPTGAELELKTGLASPSHFDPTSPPLRIARAAMERACGSEPVLLRTGGTLPILASFAERRIPAIVSGFGLPQDNFHAPDESFSLNGLELGRRSARALYEDLGAGLARGA